MALNDKQRLDLLTAPGGAFPLRERTVDGVTLTVFDHDPLTMRDAFLATRDHDDRLALVYRDERWTYTEQWTIMATLAHALRDDLGVVQGDRVGIAMRNYPEFVFVFGALQLIGAVAVPFNAWLKGPELTDLLAEARPVVLFADQERVALLRDQDLASTGVRTTVGVRCTDLGEGVVDYPRLFSGRPARTDAPVCTVGPDDASTILFTSGTTGRPKAVTHSHQNHTASLLNKLIRAVRVDVPDDGRPVTVSPPALSCKLVTFPFFHIAGLNTMYNSLYAGQPLILMYKWNAEEAVRLVETEKVNEISGPPFVIQTFLDAAAVSGRDVSSLRSIGLGGAAAPAHTVNEVRRVLGDTAIPRTGYGMTETTSGVVAISGADLVERPSSVGRPLPTVEIAILDGSGREVARGAEGEVAVRGPQVVRGYTGVSDDQNFKDGWFRTGDLGRVDADGFIHLVGRLKDVVIRGGENINCSEVEGCLEAHPDVVEAATIGAPHSTLGEELVAIVRVATGSTVDAEELRRYVGGKLAAFKVPARVAVVPDPLPRTPSGKIVKRDIAQRMGLTALLDARL
jgi:acyl-CoA synthetase (AMP-forming)/AMP-acid ligase II